MDTASTNNKLLQTLTDSIPESLVKNSPSGYSALDASSSSVSTSSWFSMLTDNWITIIIVVIGLAFFVINFMSDNWMPSFKQQFANTYSYITHFFQNIYLDTTNQYQQEQERHNQYQPQQPQVADGSQPFLKKRGELPEENIPQIHNLQAPIPHQTKNPRQHAQFNQMPGINSGKRVGQHIASEPSHKSYDNLEQDSLENDLQNAAQGITNSASYSADDTNSGVQSKSTAGWCFIGQDNNTRNCIKVGANDTCLSGDIFPTNDICINPNLRT